MSSNKFSYYFPGALPVKHGVFDDGNSWNMSFGFNCVGNESELLDCVSTSTTCSHHSAAVVCQGKMA